MTTPTKLSEVNFTDLYISTAVTEPPVFRGLKWHGMPHVPIGVTEPPSTLIADTRMLFSKVVEYFEANKQPEFPLTYDGIHYRCTLIAAAGLNGGQAKGMDWTIRKTSSRMIPIEKIGFDDDIMREMVMMGLQRSSSGLLCVTGSFGSGKTTTAYSLFDHWVAKTCEVGITVEDPPEIPIARQDPRRGTIKQIDVTGRSVVKTIQQARRWAPRFFFMGEIRTDEAATEMLHMAISGPMVICTLHANDPVNAIRSLVKFAQSTMGDSNAREMVSASLLGVLHQELHGGRMKGRFFNLTGQSAATMKTRIRVGDYASLNEDLNYQEIHRANARKNGVTPR